MGLICIPLTQATDWYEIAYMYDLAYNIMPLIDPPPRRRRSLKLARRAPCSPSKHRCNNWQDCWSDELCDYDGYCVCAIASQEEIKLTRRRIDENPTDEQSRGLQSHRNSVDTVSG